MTFPKYNRKGNRSSGVVGKYTIYITVGYELNPYSISGKNNLKTRSEILSLLKSMTKLPLTLMPSITIDDHCSVLKNY